MAAVSDPDAANPWRPPEGGPSETPAPELIRCPACSAETLEPGRVLVSGRLIWQPQQQGSTASSLGMGQRLTPFFSLGAIHLPAQRCGACGAVLLLPPAL